MTDAKTSSHELHAAPSIRLRLVRSHGRAVDAFLDIPAIGGGLAAALELDAERLSEMQWRNANRCQIRPEGAGWVLVNDSAGLVCVLNDVQLRPSTLMPLAIGDAIELGLLRFEVEAQLPLDLVPPAVQIVQPAKSLRHPDIPHASTDAGEFELRDLAKASADEGVGWRGTPDLNASDPLGLGVRVVGVHPKVSSLDRLMREPATYAPVNADRSELQHRLLGAAAPLQPEGEADDAHLGLRSKPALPVDEVFVKLHEEFQRVVRDPGQLAGHGDWGTLLSPRSEVAPSFDALAHAAGRRDIFEILGRERGIDQLIESFDALGHSPLFDNAENEDVLCLFAPEFAQNGKHTVPSLTRREHHELSPDSHVRIGATRRDEQEPPL